MTKISYTDVSNAATRSTSQFPSSYSKVMAVLKSGSANLGNLKSKPLYALTLAGVLVIFKVLLGLFFAGKTRIVIEPNPYEEGAQMLRFIKKTIKLTMGMVVALVVTLLLSFAAIIILLIQLIAHAS